MGQTKDLKLLKKYVLVLMTPQSELHPTPQVSKCPNLKSIRERVILETMFVNFIFYAKRSLTVTSILELFCPKSLSGDALTWFSALPHGSIKSFLDLVENFVSHYAYNIENNASMMNLCNTE